MCIKFGQTRLRSVEHGICPIATRYVMLCYSEEEASKTFAPFVLFVIPSDKNLPTIRAVFV